MGHLNYLQAGVQKNALIQRVLGKSLMNAIRHKGRMDILFIVNMSILILETIYERIYTDMMFRLFLLFILF